MNFLSTFRKLPILDPRCKIERPLLFHCKCIQNTWVVIKQLAVIGICPTISGIFKAAWILWVFFYMNWWVVCHHLLNLLHYVKRQFCLHATLGSKQWLTSTICLFVTTSLCTNILTEDIRAPNRMQNFYGAFFIL